MARRRTARRTAPQEEAELLQTCRRLVELLFDWAHPVAEMIALVEGATGGVYGSMQSRKEHLLNSLSVRDSKELASYVKLLEVLLSLAPYIPRFRSVEEKETFEKALSAFHRAHVAIPDMRPESGNKAAVL